MIKILILIAISIALIGTLPKPDRERLSDVAREVDARMAVQQLARDPGSVQFRNMRVTGTVVCGWFNARNGFGGMSGFQPFVHVAGRVLIDAEAYAKYCTRVVKSDRLS